MRHRFSQSAKTYAGNIDIQPIIAQFVASQAQQHIPATALTLDIGCATGQLQQLLPMHRIIGIDAAENMCATAIAPHRSSHHAICADALNLPFADNAINAAISSLCFQWLPLTIAASELHRVLKPNAIAIIATLSHGTMAELQSIYAQTNTPPRLLHYLTSAEIAATFKHHGFAIINHHSQKNIMHHPSAWHFFKQLKAIGANQASNQPPLAPTQLKQLMQLYDQQFMQNNNVPVTYNWDCLTLTKPSPPFIIQAIIHKH